MINSIRGRSIELYGNEDSGKTKFALSLIDKDDIALLIDCDRKIYDLENNKENTLLCHLNDLEEIYKLLKETVKYLDIVIIDSLPSLKTKSYDLNLDNKEEDKNIFIILQKIISLCKTNKCTIVLINQYRFNKNIYTYGVNNLIKYYSLRVEMNNKKPIITYCRIPKKNKLLDLL